MLNIEIHGYGMDYCEEALDIRRIIWRILAHGPCFGTTVISIVAGETQDCQDRKRPFLRIFWKDEDLDKVVEALIQLNMDMQIICINGFLKKASEKNRI